VTEFDVGSMRDTLPSQYFATHTDPAPVASPHVADRVGTIAIVRPVTGSMRQTVALPSDPTHTESKLNSGSPASGPGGESLRLAGLRIDAQ
jgi:hypothetical protein